MSSTEQLTKKSKLRDGHRRACDNKIAELEAELTTSTDLDFEKIAVLKKGLEEKVAKLKELNEIILELLIEDDKDIDEEIVKADEYNEKAIAAIMKADHYCSTGAPSARQLKGGAKGSEDLKEEGKEDKEQKPLNPDPQKPSNRTVENQYKHYAAMVPAGKLIMMIDQEHGDVDKHLSRLSEKLNYDSTRNRLVHELGVPNADDLEAQYGTRPVKFKVEVLKKWKLTKGFQATYGNLLIALLEAGDLKGAFALTELWGSKVPGGVSGGGGSTSGGSGGAPKIDGGKRELDECLEVIIYKNKNEDRDRFDLKSLTSDKWRQIGAQFKIPQATLNDWWRETMGQAQVCWTNVMTQWMHDGKGYPVSWDSIYDVLEDLQMAEVAKKLKYAVEHPYY